MTGRLAVRSFFSSALVEKILSPAGNPTLIFRLCN